EFRRLLVSVLKEDGYEVVEAEDGLALLATIEDTLTVRRERPDAFLVVADVRMPGLTGLDVLAILRCANWATPVILITAFGDEAWYVLGPLNSAAVRRSRLYLRAAPLIERLVARLGEREIVLSRFVYGTRIASMFFWGVHGLPYGRFAAFDLVGCLLSAIA